MWWFECRDIDMVSRLAYYYMSSKESYYVERRYWCSSSMSLFCRSHLCCHHYRCLSSFHDRFHFCYYRCCHSFSHHRRFHPQHHFGIVVIVVIIIIVLNCFLSTSLIWWKMKSIVILVAFFVICFVIIILVALSSSSSFCGHSLRYQQCLCDWRNHRWLHSSSARCFSLLYSCHCIIVIYSHVCNRAFIFVVIPSFTIVVLYFCHSQYITCVILSSLFLSTSSWSFLLELCMLACSCRQLCNQFYYMFFSLAVITISIVNLGVTFVVIITLLSLSSFCWS